MSNPVNPPTMYELGQWLNDLLCEVLGSRYDKLKTSVLSQAGSVVDGTTVLLLSDSAGQPRAVLLCSSPSSPGMVERAMNRAQRAKKILGTSLGAPILDPLLEGKVKGLSYAVLPYCKTFSRYRPVWWIQRALICRPIFDWLWRVNEHTLCDADPDTVELGFAEPLRNIIALKPALNDRLLAAAMSAGERLQTKKWKPRHVLMHGDFWKGNILLRPADSTSEHVYWRDRFAVIDWAGSNVRGYALFDLIRMAQSMHLDPRQLRLEIERHCRLLECDPADATSYLMAALGHILINIEHFPIDLYVRMAETSFMTLAHALE